MSGQRVVVLGRGPVSASDPVVTADDLGLTRGDGCFDATLVVARPDGPLVMDWDAHLARLARSASAMGLDLPPEDAWAGALDLLLDGWTGTGSVLKFLLTRGRETEPAGPTAILTLTELDEHTVRQRPGLKVITLDRGHAADAHAAAPWLLGGVKTLSYAVNVAVRREAERRGADDVLFLSSDGYALEGPTSGLVWLRDGRLGTTPEGATGILHSITVAKAEAGAAAAGTPMARALLTREELDTCDGLWLLSSGRGVAPILELDGRAVLVDAAMTGRLLEWTGFDHL